MVNGYSQCTDKHNPDTESVLDWESLKRSGVATAAARLAVFVDSHEHTWAALWAEFSVSSECAVFVHGVL